MRVECKRCHGVIIATPKQMDARKAIHNATCPSPEPTPKPKETK